jgi:CheY-like chemotaxis protein
MENGRILVVDDEQGSQDYLCDLLIEIGYEVYSGFGVGPKRDYR